LRHAAFTTISLLSTTGFTTENYELWPHLSITLCFFLFFIGGSAGSTTGGLKIIRTVLIFKYLYFELKKLLHPNVVYNIKIGKKIIDEDIIKNTLGFYLFYIIIFVLFSIFISFFNIDLITSISLSASSLGNIGPGLGLIGPHDNWGHLPNAVKIISSFCMLLGRLEIFTVMVLVSRLFFK
jgi:trk system potassium uptake protein TrkH